jgi:toxin secretion/phage lysis holin
MLGTLIATVPKVIIGALAAFVFFLFGDLDVQFQTLLFFLATDFIIGFFGAIVQKKLESRKAWIGFGKKIVTLLIVALAYQIDKIMGTSYVHLVATYGYIGSELLSIIENLGILGVPLPKKLLDLFKVFGDKLSLDSFSKKS